MESRFRVVPAAYLLLLRAGPTGPEVLLHLRQGTGYRDGHWAVVAGHVEAGESVLQAAVREAAEEAGVRVALADLEPLCTLHRTIRGGAPIDQRVDFFLAARRWGGEPRVREPAKAAAMAFAPLSHLPEPTVPHERRVLDAVRAGSVPAILTDGF
ncbi:MAG: NUDIX domain-containing protein [Nocardioidaceae bacterium]|nr:NUDIX domain-containing protein [Nocardioidaceae bacterium]